MTDDTDTDTDTSRPSIEALALAAFEALPEASAMVFDTDLRYVIVRGPALARHGCHPADLEGRPVQDALGPERWAFYEPLYRAALQGETRSVETPSPDGKGSYLVQVGPLRVGDGDVVGGVSFAVEITARKGAEEQFRALINSAPDATVVVNGEGRIVHVNARAAVLFGYAEDELAGQPVEMLVPERFRGAHLGLRDGYLGDPHPRPMGVDLELVGRRMDGSEFPVEVSLGSLETDQGLLVVATICDITDRQRAERDAAHYLAVVESSHDAIIGKDLDGFVTSWNRGAEHLYGYSEAEMRGKSISVLVPAGYDDELSEILRRVRSGEQMEEFETVRSRKDGTQVDVSLTVSPIRSPNGTVVGASTIARDITDRLRYQEQLRFLAEHDALTGAMNRRRFERDLTEQIGRAHRYGEQAALLIIDIDGFKQVNDTHGHQAGDSALKEIAVALRRRLRGTDTVARIGGDEFAILLPYADETQAAVIVKDLRRVIREAKVDLGSGSRLSLSASFGVAFINKDTASGESAFAAADQAMFKAKPTRARPA